MILCKRPFKTPRRIPRRVIFLIAVIGCISIFYAVLPFFPTPETDLYNPANKMPQNEIDAIWNKWRRTGHDVTFHNQFKARPDRLVAQLSERMYFGNMPASQNGGNSNIPRIIHQIYKTNVRGKIEEARLSYMDTWITMNWGYEYKLWTDNEMWRFVKHNYPENIRKAYKRLPLIIQKTDFFRYLVVNKLGGYYSDTDTRCTRNVDWWRIDHQSEIVDFIVGLEWSLPPPDFPNNPISITNWAFASTPNHPILNLAISTIAQAIFDAPDVLLRDTTQVVELTGPMQWTRVISSHLASSRDKQGQRPFREAVLDGNAVFFENGSVLVLPPVAFNPGSFEPNCTMRDERTMLYHEFAGNRGWKLVKAENE